MSDIKIEYATNLVDKAVLSYLQNKIPVAGFSHYDVWLEDHAQAFTVAKMMSEDLLQETQKALVRALQQGKSFHQFKQELKPYLMSKGWWGEQFMLDPKDPTGTPKLVQLGSTRRLKLIFETNIRTAQAKGQWERIWKNRDFFPYLEYIESTSDSQREQHLEFVGLILPVEHPFWDKNFPPNGYNCKCSVLALTKKDAIAKKGEDGLKADIEKANRLIEQEKEFENPRQKGRKVKHHRTVTPTFAYNAGKIDTVGLLDKIYQRKHGENALWQMQENREKYLSGLFQIYCLNKLLIGLKEKANPKEVQKLSKDTSTSKDREHETHAALLWFAKKKQDGDTLRRYQGSAQNPPDFEIVHKDGTVTSIDLMYTMGESAESKYSLAKRVEKLNDRFKTTDGFKNELRRIQDHLSKANIVIIDLRHLNAQTRAKIGTEIAKLPREQQDKIHLIVKETQ